MASPDVEKKWAALMRAALDGDQDAYRRLLISLTAFLRMITRRNSARIGIGEDEVEDIVQETLLALHLKRHTWDVERPIAPWIRAIARNKLIDCHRRRPRASMLPIDTFSETLAADSEPFDRSDLDHLIAKLPEKQRDLVRSLSIEGRSVEETGRRLNMQAGAVRVALHRAIKALAALYRDVDQ